MNIKFDRSLIRDHYFVVILLFAFIAMLLCGPGNSLIGSMVCVGLSITGLLYKQIRVDLFVFGCMFFCFVWGILSALYHGQDIFTGYVPQWMIYFLVYMLFVSFSDNERAVFERLLLSIIGLVLTGLILYYFFRSVLDGSSRFDLLIGNANGLGIFLVLVYFVLLAHNKDQDYFVYLEPMVLTGLAMTLSMGSFLSFGVGLLYLFLCDCKKLGFLVSLTGFVSRLTRVILCFWIGILFYLSAGLDILWVSMLVLLVYVLFIALYPKIMHFLDEHIPFCFFFVLWGTVIAGCAVYLRPSSIATFLERIEMMKSGIFYLTQNPLFGVGQYQWRGLDFKDGGVYFNTWCIHNLFLHIGAELGLFAVVCLLALFVYYFFDDSISATSKAIGLSFFIHSLIDIAFFYESITLFLLFSCIYGKREDHSVVVVNKKVPGVLSFNIMTKNLLFFGCLLFSLCYLATSFARIF